MRISQSQKGMSIIQLMLLVVMVSVIATALWNLQLNMLRTDFGSYDEVVMENGAKFALEDIKHHMGLAGYDLEKGKKAFEIEKKAESEVIRIRHNGVSFEYYVDDENNLIKKVETSEEVIAENIKSLKTARLGKRKIVVTLSPLPLEESEGNKIKTLSKSFSAVIEMKSLL